MSFGGFLHNGSSSTDKGLFEIQTFVILRTLSVIFRSFYLSRLSMLEYHLMTTSHYSSLKLFSKKLRHSGF